MSRSWVLIVALLASCQCDGISQCEDDCDETFPEDELRRSGCYQQCADRDYECNASPDETP